jgi:hypothetical protein
MPHEEGTMKKLMAGLAATALLAGAGAAFAQAPKKKGGMMKGKCAQACPECVTQWKSCLKAEREKAKAAGTTDKKAIRKAARAACVPAWKASCKAALAKTGK